MKLTLEACPNIEKRLERLSVFMKRVVTVIMVLSMMVNLFSMSVMAEDATSTNDGIVDRFVENVYAIEHKEEFVDLLAMVRDVEATDNLLIAYEQAFGELSSGQQTRVESFGVTLDAMNAFVTYIMDANYDEDNLRDYLGLGTVPEDKQAFRDAITNSREEDFRTKLVDSGVSLELLDSGFARMDTLFELLGDAALANDIGLFSVPFLVLNRVTETTTNVTTETMSIDETEAERIIKIANAKLDDDIDQADTIYNGLGEFAAFYNTASVNDKAVMFDYMDIYGFVNVITSTTTATTTNTGGGGGGGGAAVVLDTIEDDPLAAAAPVTQETKQVTIQASSLVFDESMLAITVPQGAFDSVQSLSVDVFTEEDLKAGGTITTGYEDADELLALQGDVYKIDASKAFGKKLTVSIPVDLPEDFTAYHTLGIYEYDEFLGEWLYVGGTYDETTKMVTVEVERSSYYAVMTYNKYFTDIDDSWAKDYIEYVASKHIINGRTETLFVPEGTLTRAEFTKLLAYVGSYDISNRDSGYTDVAEEAWYAGSVTAAKSAGIVESVIVDEFRPDDAITREEMVTILMNFYSEQTGVDYKTMYSADALTFDDSAEVVEWAREAVVGASTLGIVNGKDNNMFDPSNTATRAEAAKIIKILLDLLDGFEA